MRVERILSFDCANRSLGVLDADVNVEIEQDLIAFAQTDRLCLAIAEAKQGDYTAAYAAVKDLANITEFIKVRFSGVVDVLGCKLKDTDPIFRVKCLKAALDKLEPANSDTFVLIERQPPTRNYKSSSVQDQICMYYADCKLALMNPRAKNRIHVLAGLEHSVFAKRCRDLYTANKQHSAANIAEFSDCFDLHLLDGIKKANHDDIADAVMQMLVAIPMGVFC